MKINSANYFECLPACILFDLDNTLYEYNRPHEKALVAVSDKLHHMFSIHPKHFSEIYIKARLEIKARLINTAASHSRLLYFQKCLEIMGLGSQPLLALDLEQSYWISFLKHAELFDGVKEFLDSIRLLGIPSVIVTDLTAQIQFKKITYFQLDRYFEYVVSSEESGADKPSKNIFELALEKVAYTSGPIWMIGDDAAKDIAGSKSAINAITLQKINNSLYKDQESIVPDILFKDFEDLRHFVVKIQPDAK